MAVDRITDPVKFRLLMDDVLEQFGSDDESGFGHVLPHDIECIKETFGHTAVLNWDFFVWAHHNGEKYDGIICFCNDNNPKFNKKIFSEFLWLSKNPNIGGKLFFTAMSFAKENGFEYCSMGLSATHPKRDKVANFYNKLGFVKDSETYISKL